MKNIGEKIKQIRQSKGLSQEELAEKANVNLRTVQRLENNINVPRGQTLVLLCNALGVELENIAEYGKKKDSGFLTVFYLSILSFLVMPFGNIIVPFMLWLMKKDKITGFYKKGKRVILIQTLWTIVSMGLLIMFFFKMIHTQGNFYWRLIYLYLLLVLVNLGYAIYSAVKTHRDGKEMNQNLEIVV